MCVCVRACMPRMLALPQLKVLSPMKSVSSMYQSFQSNRNFTVKSRN